MLESFFGRNLDLPVERAWSKTFLKKISGLEFFSKSRNFGGQKSKNGRTIAEAPRPLCNVIRFKEVSDYKKNIKF